MTPRLLPWSCVTLTASVLSACSTPTGGPVAPQAASLEADARAQAMVVTASSVEALDGRLDSVKPAVRTPAGAEIYLSPGSCLGSFGPLGAYGPLGMLGPIGSNAWNVSYWLLPVGDWSDWSRKMTSGPLSEKGPLGPNGPLSDDAYYGTMPRINDFANQLKAGGVWGILGPLGPLGALGPLGPLGPVGAHGFETDRAGNYLRKGQVQRTVSVPYGGSTRTYELFEQYSEERARKMEDNDTSFMVTGELRDQAEAGRFRFASRESQWVSVLVVPEKQLDDFDLELRDGAGRKLAVSQSRALIDFVQIQLPAGARIEADVRLRGTAHWLSHTYRLYVTGSTGHFRRTDVRGDHQVSL